MVRTVLTASSTLERCTRSTRTLELCSEYGTEYYEYSTTVEADHYMDKVMTLDASKVMLAQVSELLDKNYRKIIYLVLVESRDQIVEN